MSSSCSASNDKSCMTSRRSKRSSIACSMSLGLTSLLMLNYVSCIPPRIVVSGAGWKKCSCKRRCMDAVGDYVMVDVVDRK